MASYAHLLVPVAVLSLLLLPFPSHCADPSPLQDFCIADLKSPLFLNGYPCRNPALATSDDFVYSGFKQQPSGYDQWGLNVTFVTAAQFPALNTLGLTINRCTLLPGGSTQFRTNPRASSLVMATEGQILEGFYSTNDNKLYVKRLTPGDLFIIPPGLMHFTINVGKGPATFYASLNSQNPGGQIVGLMDETIIERIRSEFPTIKLARSKFSEFPVIKLPQF